MISAIHVKPYDHEHVKVKLTYTDDTRVKIRGDITDTVTSTASLARGQLRAGLSNPGFADMTVNNTWQAIDNPYGWNTAYLMALLSPVGSSNVGANASSPSIQELQTAVFLLALGAGNPGIETTVEVADQLGSGLTTYQTATNLFRGTASTAAHIDSVTEIGLAVEPIVQGPRDTSGKTSGTLARFTIPKGSQPGDILGFESKNPTRVSIQAFVGQDINRLTFRLVNQHNESISDLAGEHFSAVVVLAYD